METLDDAQFETTARRQYGRGGDIGGGDFEGGELYQDSIGQDVDEMVRSQSLAASYAMRGHSRQPSLAGSQVK